MRVNDKSRYLVIPELGNDGRYSWINKGPITIYEVLDTKNKELEIYRITGLEKKAFTVKEISKNEFQHVSHLIRQVIPSLEETIYGFISKEEVAKLIQESLTSYK